VTDPSLTPGIDAFYRAFKETKRQINESTLPDGQKRVMLALIKAASKAVAHELDVAPNGRVSDCLKHFEAGFSSAMSSVLATLTGNLATESRMNVMQTFLRRTSFMTHEAFAQSVGASPGEEFETVSENIHHHKPGNA
jgi:hypothetical protein